MTNYVDLTRRRPFKRMAWRVLTNRTINTTLVPLLQKLPPSAFIAKIPVIGRNATLSLPNGTALILQEPDRCQIAKEIFWSGGRLHNSADQLALNCAIGLSADARLFLDIGSYTGLFALAVAQSNLNVLAYAYEIVPENFLLLWRNVIANDLVGRVAPQLYGLGDAQAEIRIPYSFGEGTLASSVALDAMEESGTKIPVGRLDDQHASFVGRAVFKIDVETFEWQVLDGGKYFIQRNRPDIICEILRKAPHIPQIEAFLAEHGYRSYHITTDGLKLSQAIVPNVSERDWLFTSRTPSELSRLGLPVLSDRNPL